MAHDSHAHGHGGSQAAAVPQAGTGNQIQHMQVFLFGLGGFMLIAVAVVATYIYYGWEQTSLKFEREEMGVQVHVPAITARKTVLNGTFESYSIVDAAEGRVRVPLSVAKEMVIRNYASRNKP
jgi:hypothetical protein